MYLLPLLMQETLSLDKRKQREKTQMLSALLMNLSPRSPPAFVSTYLSIFPVNKNTTNIQ